MLLLTLISPGVMAKSDFLEMDLEDLLNLKITGADLEEETLLSVPSIVTVFSQQEIENLGLDYLFELARLVPGFQVNRGGETSYNYAMGAMGRRFNSTSREIALVVDGRLIENPRSPGAHGALPLFPLANIERVEFITGPGSAIYGSGAFTAIINIISRQGQKDVAAVVGNYGKSSLVAHWSETVAAWTADVFVRANQDDGVNYELWNGQSTNDPREELVVDMAVTNQKTSVRFLSSNLQAENYYLLETLQNGFNRDRTNFYDMDIHHQWNMSAAWKLNFGLHYTRHTQNNDLSLLPQGALRAVSLPTSDAALLGRSELKANKSVVSLASDWSMDKTSSLQMGAEYALARLFTGRLLSNYDLYDVLQRRQTVDYDVDLIFPSVVELPIERAYVAVYAQWIKELSDKNRLVIGGRLDDYEFVGEYFSPRLAWIHQWDQANSFKFMYGESFRAPTFSETQFVNNPFILGAPDLKHEIVKTWSAVWMNVFELNQFSFSAFTSRYENPIVVGFIGNMTTYVNGEDQYGDGVMLDFTRALNAQWTIKSSVTYFAHVPFNSLSEADNLASLILNYHTGKWNINLSGNYQGTRLYWNSPTTQTKLKATRLANANISYDINAAVKLSFSAKNLGGVQYMSAPAGKQLPEGIPNRGMETSATLEWQW
jgi:outer membrane receptor protein involved in Fe transport